MEVKIVCKENVRPSSPTPSHLRTFKLSLLDQLIPNPYAPIILFYLVNDATNNLDVSKRLNHLKKSLSETLTRFYPLAGKIKDDLSIDCNDEGAYFIEAEVNYDLSKYLGHPNIYSLHQFLPCELVPKELTAGSYVTNIQANIFKCGGIAIGLCISHRIVDGSALSTFLKGWTATARDCKEAALINPDFTAARSLFTAEDLWLRDSAKLFWGSLFKKGNCMTRRIVFKASAINNLKKQLDSSSGVKCPSRVEAISAFLWKCTMSASEELFGYQRRCFITHLVDLRRRVAAPTLNSMGNLLWIASAKYKSESKPEMDDLVDKVRKSIAGIDGQFVNQMTGEQGNRVMSDCLNEMAEMGSNDDMDHLGFSSWCRFGYYDADFGWGKPVCVTCYPLTGPLVLNLVMLVDTRFGNGIEAWVTLDEKHMAVLQANPELLKFGSLDPSPLFSS